VGGQILHDKAGTVALTTTHILPTLNYHKALSSDRNTYVSLAFMAGIVQRKFDRSKMTTNNQFDGDTYNSSLSDGEYLVTPTFTYFDGSVGMSMSSQIGDNENNNFYVGVAYHHFNKSKKASFYESTNSEVTPKKVVSGGVRMSMNNNSYITVQSDYTTQGANKEIVLGAMYTMNVGQSDDSKTKFHVGSYIRWGDAIIPVAKIETGSISIATSYDANISSLKTSSRGQGGYEVSLTYQKSKKENSSLDAVRCPKF